MILTALGATYQDNELDLGDIGGIPGVLDAGQSNDSDFLDVIFPEAQGGFRSGRYQRAWPDPHFGFPVSACREGAGGQLCNRRIPNVDDDADLFMADAAA